MKGPKSVKELQIYLNYSNRTKFLNDVINPLTEFKKIYRDGKAKSPTSVIKLSK